MYFVYTLFVIRLSAFDLEPKNLHLFKIFLNCCVFSCKLFRHFLSFFNFSGPDQVATAFTIEISIGSVLLNISESSRIKALTETLGFVQTSSSVLNVSCVLVYPPFSYIKISYCWCVLHSEVNVMQRHLIIL